MEMMAPPGVMVILNVTANWSAYNYLQFCVIGYETDAPYTYMYVHHKYFEIVQLIPITMQWTSFTNVGIHSGLYQTSRIL